MVYHSIRKHMTDPAYRRYISMQINKFPTINMEATGRRITALRKAGGYSVKDLQEYFGFEAPQAIYKWQKGLSLPTVDNLLALSALLGVPMDSIVVKNAAVKELPLDSDSSLLFLAS